MDNAKTNTPKNLKHSKVMRMSINLTSSLCVGFGSSTNKTLNPQKFCIKSSNKKYFGVLHSFVDCWMYIYLFNVIKISMLIADGSSMVIIARMGRYQLFD